MKRVTLKSLSFVNFKGEKERTTVFNSDVTTISGGNGLGKSRHFDAFTWLLFGKDSQDRKDYEIKSIVNGEELHKAECSITGVLDVDGQEITLKRALVEDWVKPRGQAELRYKGNHTECWWNDTPVNVSEYDRRVKAIVDSSLFKMITNPAFFVNMNWKLQREQLFQLAGTITDVEIASSKPEFALLLDKISGKSLADFKKELAARKKRLQDELAQVQPRIDQTHKMMPENEDFHAIEVEIEKADREIADIDKAIADVTAAVRKKYEAEQSKQSRVNGLKSDCQRLLFEARTQAQNAAFAANAKRREIENEIKSKTKDFDTAQKEVSSGLLEVARLHRDIDRLKAEQDTLRKDWFAENSKSFNGDTICPVCGQKLPDTMLLEAQGKFADAKIKKCNDISENGKEIGNRVKELEAKVREEQQGVDNARKDIDSLKNELENLKLQLDSIAVVDVATIAPESIPGWAAMQKEISEIEATISTDNSKVDTTELQGQKAELNKRRGELVAHLANRDVIDRCEKEIADLEANGKKVAQQIADLEREEYTIQQFTKAKVDECEKRINGMFQYVRFRLFDYTIDGNPFETCIPLVDGVPYGSANNAGKINAGLDIINTLCRFYGICAPIFIDNRESVNEIIETQSQIINLVVTKDNKLTIN